MSAARSRAEPGSSLWQSRAGLSDLIGMTRNFVARNDSTSASLSVTSNGTSVKWARWSTGPKPIHDSPYERGPTRYRLGIGIIGQPLSHAGQMLVLCLSSIAVPYDRRTTFGSDCHVESRQVKLMKTRPAN